MGKRVSLTGLAIGREIKRRHQTQAEIAKKMRLSANTVSSWCNGVRSPKCDDIPKIAKAIGCRVSDLIRDIPSKTQGEPPQERGIDQ